MAASAHSASETPWKTLSAEELEKQYSPSRWVIRMKAEEVISTFVQTGIQVAEFLDDPRASSELPMRLRGFLIVMRQEMEEECRRMGLGKTEKHPPANSEDLPARVEEKVQPCAANATFFINQWEQHISQQTEDFPRQGFVSTRKARATRRNQLDVPYGDCEGEKMDIYFPDEDSKAFPLFLFFHGGYWQSGSKDDSAFMVNPLTAQGVVVVIAAYDIAPKGTLDRMVEQVTRSVAFLQRRYPSNEGIYLCGHSAGAHLAAMVLLANWTKHGVTPNLQGFLLVSGIYDLEPIISTSQNAPLHMTLEDAQRNSPQRCLEMAPARPVGPSCSVLVVVGQHDSPEFHRQSRKFYETLRRVGWKASFQQLRGVDHFDIIENLTREDDVLTQIILKTIFPTL